MLGTLPLGHRTLRRRGQDSRLNSAYNLGLENVLERVGLPAALASGALDIAKGALSVAMAPPQRPELALQLGSAAYLGHLNPPKRLYGEPPRGRGSLLLLGVLLGLGARRQLPNRLLRWPLLVSGAALLGRRYLSVATLTGLITFDALISGSDVGRSGKLATRLTLLAALWRFKENIGRVLDGTEPRLGETVALGQPDEALSAFMIHPLTLDDFYQTPRLRWLRPLVQRGLISERVLVEAATHIRPMKVGELHGMRTAEGKAMRMYLLSSPLTPRIFRERPELATRRAIEGAILARELGAEVFGLGAFWSVVGNKGLDVQAAVPQLTVTNGGAYTSGTIRAAIPGILEHYRERGRDLSEATAAVVGANGVVAFGIARTIAPQVRKVVLLGRDPERLERSAHTLRRAYPQTEFVTTTAYDDLRDAELIFSATSDPQPVIFARHVSEGTWIFDEGRPADVDDSVRAVPGVRVIPGGVVRPPGNLRSSIDLHFGEGAVPACLAETLILSVTGEYDRRSLGPQTKLENIQFFVDEARRLGFTVVD